MRCTGGSVGKGVGVIVGAGVAVGPPGVMVGIGVGGGVDNAWHAASTKTAHSQSIFLIEFMQTL